MVAALGVGTLLSPLNSSMIAVALVPLRNDFGLGAAEVTWVVTAFYLASAAGQPLMGRIGDRSGPRRLFVTGMAAAAVVCGATAYAPTFGLVCAGRAALALATATAFPSAVSMIRSVSETSGVSSSHLLGRLQIANTAGAAIGPAVGGVLETLYGWQAIIVVSSPLALLSALGVAAWAPKDGAHAGGGLIETLRVSDVPGVTLFGAALVAGLVFILELPTDPQWWLLPVAVVLTGAFVWRETRTTTPFFDLRSIAANRSLIVVYSSFTIFNLVFYLAFFGIPQTLQERGKYSSGITGLLMLPLAAVTVVFTAVVAHEIDRRGLTRILRTGAIALVGGCTLLLVGAGSLHPAAVLLMTAGLGIPYCIVNLALMQALYASAVPGEAGVASGTFQAARYLGAILATSALGVVLASGDTAVNWSITATIAIAMGAVHAGIVWRWRPPTATS
ncbi:MFS transporter [Mycolicibacterium mageritense]|uniref:MFS transporter n=1 Tax=Mycolicibacterium mageritense TaxID=53462 RepID=UPI001F2B0F5A|nr:MFS transporter [Mycolicibacterium mageritense]MCC9180362.1 MFS transporter [Mycolicibacterium mageritense]